MNISSPASAPAPRIVFFDGVCGMCNQLVNFLMARDARLRLHYAPLQGETARQMGIPEQVPGLDTLVFVDEGRIWTRTSAVVQILRQLGPFWKVLAALLWIIPRPLRDWGYRQVARVRYRLFGKHDSCRLPTEAERGRLLP